jgi:UDP-N-acetylmuramate--alanine ligase
MEIDLNKIKKVYFIGIGGIGISAIARMMIEEGKEVRGSDMSASNITHELERAGVSIDIGQKFELIPKDSELIIYTIAIEHYDEELLKKIKASGIPSLTYPESLNLISKDKYTIAISGTHGKTTTTAMTAKIALDLKLDPTVVVGSILKDQKTNFIGGKSKYFIVEACEYRRSFLNLNPNILAITNIEEDHLDYYKDIEDIKNAFKELVSKVPDDGFIVCNLEGENVADVISDTKATIIDYQTICKGKAFASLDLKVPGNYNRENAAVALAISEILSLPEDGARKSLEGFSGTWRRFDLKGETEGGALVYDDYAHHPTAVEAVLSGVREMYPGKRVIAVFQPHLYSRTKALFREFSRAFSDGDLTIIAPIYFAREEKDESINSQMLVDAVNKNGNKAIFIEKFEEISDYLKENTGEGDVVLTIGAGDIYKVGENLVKKI